MNWNKIQQPRVWVFASLIVVLATIHPARTGIAPIPGFANHALRYTSTAESHRVKALPGWGKLDINLFAGYLAAGEERSFFYAFVEAANHPRNAPVLLWLTGGPGCSSISSAFMGEHGPFFPRPGTSDQLIKNPYSYHNFAHVIYVDSPAFVGFSYSNDTNDHNMGDEKMAKQTMEFLKSWRAAYPQLAQNKFWLAGESYAGHYVVALAEEILEEISKSEESNDSKAINFQGFLLGNPSTDPKYDNEGRVAYWHSHGLISEDVKQEMEKTCNFSNVVFGPSDVVHLDQPGSKCEKAINDALDEMGDINIQGIFDDKCQEKFARSSVSPLRRRVLRSVGKPMTTVPDPPKPGIDTLDPCISKESTAYLSREDVQNALHANTSGMLDWKYDGCAPQDRLNYSNIDQLSSQIPRLKKIMKHHPELRILYYSGDTDAMVPLTGTRRWTYKLGLELHKERKVRWTAWTGEDGQVGGWLEQYRHFTYLTIRHASHEAPYTQKGRTAYVYRTWLSGKVLV